MNERDIERALQKCAENETPDVLDRVLSQLGKEQTMEKNVNFPKKKKVSLWKTLGSLAAAFALILGAGAAWWTMGVDAVVGIDVNPSLELKVNRSEKVIEAVALNEDAKTVLDGMDLKRVDLDVAVNAVIGSMLKNGYIAEHGAVNIAVESGDLKRGEELRVRLSRDVDALLVSQAVKAEVASQTVSEDKTLEKAAHESGISVGKAALAQKAGLSAEQAAVLSVKELWESANGLIPRADALAIAYRDAGISGEATRIECELDEDDGVWKYEIEFTSNGTEYDYDIDAVSGKVLWRETETKAQPKPAQSEPKPQPSENKPQPVQSGSVSRDEALAIAYADAGVTPERAECELDRDDGRQKYEIEFRVGGIEYDYEIDAATGKILKRENERDD